MTDTDTGPRTDPGGAPPPPPTAPRRLVRRRDDRMVAGVASGIAAHLGIDPSIVRILFVVLAFAGASGIVAYVACWALIPEADGPDEAVRSTRIEASGAPFWVGVGLLTVAALILVDQSWFIARGVGVPLVLIALGVALWKVGQDRQTSRAAAPPAWDAPASDSFATASEETAAMPSPTTTEPGATWTPPPVPTRGGGRGLDGMDWTPPPVPPRERSILGRLTLALVFIALGVGMTLDQLDLISFTAATAAATALLIVGVGLVVGAWVGRARWLGLVGLALVPIVLATSLASSLDVSFAGGIGDRTFHATTIDDLEPGYELGAGQLTLDLRDLELDEGRGAFTQVRLGAGEMIVIVPRDLTVAVEAEAQVGQLRLPGIDDEGTGLRRETVVGDANRPVDLRLDLRVGAGQIEVVTAARDAAPTSTEPTEEFTR